MNLSFRNIQLLRLSVAVLALFLLSLSESYAQGWCATQPFHDNQVSPPTNLWGKLHQSRLPSSGPIVVIPVAFHVIRTDDGLVGHVTTDQINQQIDVLNAAFVNSIFRFSLHSVGQVNNSVWFNWVDEGVMKQTLVIDPAHVMNIYSLEMPAPTLGVSEYAGTYPEDGYLSGIILDYKTFPGGSEPNFGEGDNAVHEVGHFTGLIHTFEGGCGALPEHTDLVDDTPYEETPDVFPSPCINGYNTCDQPGDDPIHNYMSYTDDACKYEFTPGQIVRLEEQMTLFRPSMTGVDVTLEQRAENASLLTGTTIGRWEGGPAFHEYTVPIPTMRFFPGPPEILRGFQGTVSNPAEKYHSWTQDFPDIVNHHEFPISSSFSSVLTSQFKQAHTGITIRNILDDPSIDGGAIEFKDPWLIDAVDQYGFRNQGSELYSARYHRRSILLETRAAHRGSIRVFFLTNLLAGKIHTTE